MMCLKCGATAVEGSEVCLAHGGRPGDIRRADLFEAARNLYQTDNCNIDDDAKLSEAKESGGTWVAAWVWVTDEEVG